MKNLTRRELKEICGGKAQNYIKITCQTGGASASTSNSTLAQANSYASSLCHGGAYSIVCVGDC